jgi:hypothetical protein
MTDDWTTPEFREVSVCGECTAYSGTDVGASAPDDPARLPPTAAAGNPPGGGSD